MMMALVRGGFKFAEAERIGDHHLEERRGEQPGRLGLEGDPLSGSLGTPERSDLSSETEPSSHRQ